MTERAYTYGETSYYGRYKTKGSLAYGRESVAEERVKALPKKKTSILDNPQKLIMIAFFVVVIGFVIILSRTAIIFNMNTQVAVLKDTLNVYNSQNQQTAVLLDRSTDLDLVEQTAKDKLNMDVPKAEQKVYVDVKIPDSVEIPPKDENKILSIFKSVINNCMEYLY